MENVKASQKAQRAKKRAAKRIARKQEWEESEDEAEEAHESEPEEVDDDELEFKDGEENQPANAPPPVEEKSGNPRKGKARSRRGRGVLS